MKNVTNKSKTVSKEAVAVVNKTDEGKGQPVNKQKLQIIRANKITVVTQYKPAALIKAVGKPVCPHRAGSTRALAFAVALKSKTVADYAKAQVKGKTAPAKYLGRWVAMGLLTIG